jgi:hypothetical protein
MSEQLTADQILTMSPDEATAHLGKMTADYNAANRPAAVAAPANATEAHRRLEALSSDSTWSQRLLNNDAAARKEFNSLTALVAGGTDADFAIAGVLPEFHVDSGTGAPLRDQLAAVPQLREAGIDDEAIRQVLTDQPVTKAEHDLAKQQHADRMSDPEFTKRWFGGGRAETREMTLLSIILSSEIK